MYFLYFLSSTPSERLMYVQYKTYCQKTKESYGFEMQISKVLLAEERKSTDKFLCLYDVT